MERRRHMAKKKKAREDFIFLYSKKVRISKLVQSFTVIPSREVVKYLKNKEIYLPYYFHKALIRKNIAPAISIAEQHDKFSDEMRHRLKWFDQFTIFQLEKFAKGFNLQIDVDEYKKDFWDIIVRNRTELMIDNLEFVKLQNLTMKYAKEPQETYEELRSNLDEVYFEPPGYFDGSPLEEAKETLSNATTLNEIRELGDKYSVDIPRRINKSQLVDIVARKLEFNEEQKAELEKKSILEIERYAKRRQVDVSVELRKSDMIEYILLKMPEEIDERHQLSLKIFDGINIEEYLYNLKIVEISEKLKERNKKRMMVALVTFAALITLAFIVYLIYTQL